MRIEYAPTRKRPEASASLPKIETKRNDTKKPHAAKMKNYIQHQFFGGKEHHLNILLNQQPKQSWIKSIQRLHTTSTYRLDQNTLLTMILNKVGRGQKILSWLPNSVCSNGSPVGDRPYNNAG